MKTCKSARKKNQMRISKFQLRFCERALVAVSVKQEEIYMDATNKQQNVFRVVAIKRVAFLCRL